MKTVQTLLLELLPADQQQLTAKEFVQKHYSDATTQPVSESIKIGIKSRQEAWFLGLGQTEDEAWEDAARSLIFPDGP